MIKEKTVLVCFLILQFPIYAYEDSIQIIPPPNNSVQCTNLIEGTYKSNANSSIEAYVLIWSDIDNGLWHVRPAAKFSDRTWRSKVKFVLDEKECPRYDQTNYKIIAMLTNEDLELDQSLSDPSEIAYLAISNEISVRLTS